MEAGGSWECNVALTPEIRYYSKFQLDRVTGSEFFSPAKILRPVGRSIGHNQQCNAS